MKHKIIKLLAAIIITAPIFQDAALACPVRNAISNGTQPGLIRPMAYEERKSADNKPLLKVCKCLMTDLKGTAAPLREIARNIGLPMGDAATNIDMLDRLGLIEKVKERGKVRYKTIDSIPPWEITGPILGDIGPHSTEVEIKSVKEKLEGIIYLRNLYSQISYSGRMIRIASIDEYPHISVMDVDMALRQLIAKRIGKDRKRESALSVGVGPGRLERDLIKTWRLKVSGVDVVDPLLAIAEARGVSVKLADGEHLPYENESFDIVVLPESIGHMDLDKALREAYRVLRPGGAIHIITYGQGPYIFHKFRYKIYTAGKILSSMYRCGFRDCVTIPFCEPWKDDYLHATGVKPPAQPANRRGDGSGTKPRPVPALPAQSVATSSILRPRAAEERGTGSDPEPLQKTNIVFNYSLPPASEQDLIFMYRDEFLEALVTELTNRGLRPGEEFYGPVKELALNTIQYGRGGRVVITAEQGERVTALRLYCSDSGPGIPRPDLLLESSKRKHKEEYIEVESCGVLWRTEKGSDIKDVRLVKVADVAPSAGTRTHLSWNMVNEHPYPLWLKSAGFVCNLFLRRSAPPGSPRDRFGNFTELKETLHKIRTTIGFSVALLMPIFDPVSFDPQVSDSPYVVLSFYSIDPRYIDAARIDIPGDTVEEKFEFMLAHPECVPPDYRRFMHQQWLVEYAHTRAMRALRDNHPRYRVFIARHVPRYDQREFARFSNTEIQKQEGYRTLLELAVFEQYFARRQLDDAMAYADELDIRLGLDIPAFPSVMGVESVFHENWLQHRWVDGLGECLVNPEWRDPGDPGNERKMQRWALLGVWDTNLLRDPQKVGAPIPYKPLLDVYRYWMKAGFKAFRFDAWHYFYGAPGLWETTANLLRQNGILALPETGGCINPEMVDAKSRGLGNVEISMPFVDIDKGDIQTPGGLKDFFEWYSKHVCVLYAVTHDSNIMQVQYGAMFGWPSDTKIIASAINTLFAMASPIWGVLPETGRRINSPGTEGPWNWEGGNFDAEYNIDALLHNLNYIRGRFLWLSSAENLVWYPLRRDAGGAEIFPDKARVLAFGRYSEDGRKVVITIVNLSKEERQGIARLGLHEWRDVNKDFTLHDYFSDQGLQFSPGLNLFPDGGIYYRLAPGQAHIFELEKTGSVSPRLDGISRRGRRGAASAAGSSILRPRPRNERNENRFVYEVGLNCKVFIDAETSAVFFDMFRGILNRRNIQVELVVPSSSPAPDGTYKGGILLLRSGAGIAQLEIIAAILKPLFELNERPFGHNDLYGELSEENKPLVMGAFPALKRILEPTPAQQRQAELENIVGELLGLEHKAERLEALRKLKLIAPMPDHTLARTEVDLHTHSLHSDGYQTPSALVWEAYKLGMRAIALTDHNTLDGIVEAIEAGEVLDLDIDVIPGIELAVADSSYDGIEILVYYPDERRFLQWYRSADSQNIRDAIKWMMEKQVIQVNRMIDKIMNDPRFKGLLASGGITRDVLFAEVTIRARGYPITPGSIAEALWALTTKRDPQESDFGSVFGKSIRNSDVLYYMLIKDPGIWVASEGALSPKEAIDFADPDKNGGLNGLAALCHPKTIKSGGSPLTDEQLEELVIRYKEKGLGGIQVDDRRNKPRDMGGDTDFYVRLAKKHNLGLTVGSDYHGGGKPPYPYSGGERLGRGDVGQDTFQLPEEQLTPADGNLKPELGRYIVVRELRRRCTRRWGRQGLLPHEILRKMAGTRPKANLDLSPNDAILAAI